MNEGISSLKEGFTLAEARGLLGVPVTAVNSSTGSTVQGTVDQILINSNGVQLDINGTVVDVADVTSIGWRTSSSDTMLAPTTSDSAGQTTTSSGTTATSDTTTTATSDSTTTTSVDDATATDSSDSISQTSIDSTTSDTTDTSTVSTDDSIVADYSSMTAVST